MAKWIGDPLPARDERRIDPVHPPKPPARKNKARWCKGKEGVEHLWVVGIHPSTDGFRTSRDCRVETWRSTQTGRVWRTFLCKHSVMCTSCGKIKRRASQNECATGVLDPA